MVAPEMVPYVKTGGLADVMGALPKALARLGHEVTVFLPRYGAIPFPPGDLVGSVQVLVDGLPRSAGCYVSSVSPGVSVVFVEHAAFYDRQKLYGEGSRDYGDNAARFALLPRAVLELYRTRGERPDVFHAHDWQAGLLPVYLKVFYWNDPTLGRAPTAFTIHNPAYQGYFPLATLAALGLPASLAVPEALEFYGGICYLKGGILFSEVVSTVSPQYAREIQTPGMGHGLDGALRSRATDLVGILNGVDYEEWDPRGDPHIARRYWADNASGKAACKADLLRAFRLPGEPDLPVVGVTSRFVDQKGFDYVVGAWYDLLRRPLRMVVMGTGEDAILDGFRRLVAMAPDRFAVRFQYDTALAHKIVAGADMFLMPSRFEPCGLSQMYSLRYGAVPIVRSTGGLIDTVEPFDPATGDGTGFRFDTADGTGLMWALDEALRAYADQNAWRRLMRNGMAKDFSWEQSARGYVELYERAIAHA